MRKGPRVISGVLAGKQIEVIPGNTVRPTSERVRKSFFDIIEPDLKHRTFIDVCSGSGIMGIEALSRGAARAVFVDSNRNACRQIQSFLRNEKLTAIGSVIHGSAEIKIADIVSSYDNSILFLDPPYKDDLTDDVLKSIVVKDCVSHVYYGVIEHHHKMEPLIDWQYWQIDRVTRYGETQLTFFKPNMI